MDARLNRDQLWDMVEPYERSKSMTPLLVINIVAFYSGVVAAAVIEQLHKVCAEFCFSNVTLIFRLDRLAMAIPRKAFCFLGIRVYPL